MSEFEIEPELPRLVIPAPQCGHCDNDVELDGDSAWCENCRVAWGCIEDGGVSEPDPDAEGSDVACEMIPNSTMVLEFGECILPSGHEGEHIAPYRRTEFGRTLVKRYG